MFMSMDSETKYIECIAEWTCRYEILKRAGVKKSA